MDTFLPKWGTDLDGLSHSADFKIHTRREADVIWIDLNGGFDCEIFAKSLRATCPSGVNQEQMVLDCLERVHIYRPYSSISLLATLHSLRNFVESPQGKNGLLRCCTSFCSDICMCCGFETLGK